MEKKFRAAMKNENISAGWIDERREKIEKVTILIISKSIIPSDMFASQWWAWLDLKVTLLTLNSTSIFRQNMFSIAEIIDILSINHN